MTEPTIQERAIDFEGELATAPTSQLLAIARQFAYVRLRGTTVINEATSRAIRLNRRGLDHTLRHISDTPHGRAHAYSMWELDILLTCSQYKGSEPNRNPQHSGTIIAVHRFEISRTIAAISYTICLVVKETPEAHYFYDHCLRNIEPV